jgi:tetratricopeptide (TPR) repeat protein
MQNCSTVAKPTITLSMMVKDEEKWLAQCLASVWNFVDEIVIVDTGSSDNTVNIARGFNANIYHHAWENNFSTHRNQSISYATGDWIFIMDADEVLKKKDEKTLRDAIRHPGIDSVMVAVVNFFNQRTSQSAFNQIRLFKRLPSIYYSGSVHNQLIGCRSTITCAATIYHYGYDLDSKRMQEKFNRTSSLLHKRIHQDPDNFRHYHDLAVSYSMNKRFEEAISYGIKAIQLADKTEKKGGVLVLWTYFIVASSYLIQGDFRNAEAYAVRALEKYPDHLDSHFVLVMTYHGLKIWDRMKTSSDAYFKILDVVRHSQGDFGYIVNNTAGEAWRVYFTIGDYHLENNDIPQSKKAFKEALAGAPKASECLKRIADAYKKRSFWKEALQFYEKIVEIQPDSIEGLANLGALYYENGHRDMAKRWYLTALQLEPGLVKASLRLANISVTNGEIEQCVGFCENILKKLGLPCNRKLESLSDLADLFLMIGHEFDKAGRDDLFREAAEIAITLKPQIVV